MIPVGPNPADGTEFDALPGDVTALPQATTPG
jgi:hypothetical protein